MTASRPDPRFAALVLLLLVAGCNGFSPAPIRSPVEPLPHLGAVMPDEVDHAARDLSRAILLDDAAAAYELAQHIDAIDAAREAEGLPATGLSPYAELANASLVSDPAANRDAARRLLERDDLDASLRTRLQEVADDDPLLLARARLSDRRTVRWGRLFNAVSEPTGRSLGNWLLLPARLIPRLVDVALEEHTEDPLTLRERQALDHWKRYVEQNPDSPEAMEILDEIQEAQARWLETQHRRSMKRARRAMEHGNPKLAALMAERSLRYRPEDPEALSVLAESAELAETLARRDLLSVAVSEDPAVAAPGQRDLLVALLLPDGDVEDEARGLLERVGEEAPLADEARFALSLALAERADAEAAEDASWQLLGEIADAEDGNMARHAVALIGNPYLNPWRALQVARGDVTEEKLRWLALGPLAKGPRDLDLPTPVEWLLEVPTAVGTITGLPNRIIRYPFLKSDWKQPAVLARRYLERYPEGAHATEVREYLRQYEAKRGNHVSAMELARVLGADEEELAELAEKAAEQAYRSSVRQERRDVRQAMLKQVAQRFRDTEAGRRAGLALREELEKGGAQSIRISRGFLAENPAVAGPEGLALAPGLLDGDPANGELHPRGVTLLGGRVVQFEFLGESGRPSEEPRVVRRQLSEERLARLAAQLEESSLSVTLTDRDVPVEPDADRDAFIERARLGLASLPDRRPTAESTYVYRGVRERYGLVRSRESILPVEIVLQGSFDDFGLGAFPRIRMPKKTPDAFLYED